MPDKDCKPGVLFAAVAVVALFMFFLALTAVLVDKFLVP